MLQSKDHRFEYSHRDRNRCKAVGIEAMHTYLLVADRSNEQNHVVLNRCSEADSARGGEDSRVEILRGCFLSDLWVREYACTPLAHRLVVLRDVILPTIKGCRKGLECKVLSLKTTSMKRCALLNDF